MLPRFSPKNLGYIQNIFFLIKNKIKINFIFWLCFVSKLWSRYSYWNRKSTQAFHIKILRRLEPFDKERISVHKLYNTANQNNSVIYIFWGLKQNLLLLNMIVRKDCQSSLIRSNVKRYSLNLWKIYTFIFIFHIEAWHLLMLKIDLKSIYILSRPIVHG